MALCFLINQISIKKSCGFTTLLTFHVNRLPSRGSTWNSKSYFLWETAKKYSTLSSAAVLIGTLRVKSAAYMALCFLINRISIKKSCGFTTLLMFHVNRLHSRGSTWNSKSYFLWETAKKYSTLSSAAVLIGTLRVKSAAYMALCFLINRISIKKSCGFTTLLMFHVNRLHSRGSTWNSKSYFLWETAKKYSTLSSAAVLIGTLRVKSAAYTALCFLLFILPFGELEFFLYNLQKMQIG